MGYGTGPTAGVPKRTLRVSNVSIVDFVIAGAPIKANRPAYTLESLGAQSVENLSAGAEIIRLLGTLVGGERHGIPFRDHKPFQAVASDGAPRMVVAKERNYTSSPRCSFPLPRSREHIIHGVAADHHAACGRVHAI